VAELPSFYASNTPASQNENWSRLNNDPLFAVSAPHALSTARALSSTCSLSCALQIKRQQQDQLRKIKENPVKMLELLKAVTEVRLVA
jgi:hypothetical protein